MIRSSSLAKQRKRFCFEKKQQKTFPCAARRERDHRPSRALKRITLRGSIVGTRRDLDEAIAIANGGKVRADITRAPLSDINHNFAGLKAGRIEGRIVLDFA